MDEKPIWKMNMAMLHFICPYNTDIAADIDIRMFFTLVTFFVVVV